MKNVSNNVIKKALTKVIKEEFEFDDENSFSVEPEVGKQPREVQIQKMFGKYEEQIPNDVLRYMRKNPQLIMNRLVRIYGDKFLDYAENAYMNYMKK